MLKIEYSGRREDGSYLVSIGEEVLGVIHKEPAILRGYEDQWEFNWATRFNRGTLSHPNLVALKEALEVKVLSILVEKLENA